MARYETVHSCGHKGETGVTGVPEKREIKLAEIRALHATIPCHRCKFNAEVAALRAEGLNAEADAMIKRRNRANGHKGATALRVEYGDVAASSIIARAKANR
ncbi:MAG TPA: hypothetical protein DEU95_10455 [Chloroflexi bacterium]|jgi:hypothetical protein|nr:hypothetical protein [Chloroflexota bacterium]HCG30138.1 hypothetical protein [Chloroflexota bacterium]